MFENQNCDRLYKLVEEYFKIPENKLSSYIQLN